MEEDYPGLDKASAAECDDTDDSELFPSLTELSMERGDREGEELEDEADGHSASYGSSREDLMTMIMCCNEQGDYGVVLRHFTVLAAIPVSP